MLPAVPSVDNLDRARLSFTIKMGLIEEAVSPADLLDDPEKLKEAGNDFFKKNKWEDALNCYTQVGLIYFGSTHFNY